MPSSPGDRLSLEERLKSRVTWGGAGCQPHHKPQHVGTHQTQGNLSLSVCVCVLLGDEDERQYRNREREGRGYCVCVCVCREKLIYLNESASVLLPLSPPPSLLPLSVSPW